MSNNEVRHFAQMLFTAYANNTFTSHAIIPPMSAEINIITISTSLRLIYTCCGIFLTRYKKNKAKH